MSNENKASGASILVIGAGIGRTGTNSLKKALEIIYDKPCYHLKEIYLNHHDHIHKWIEIDKKLNDPNDPKLDRESVYKLLDGYVATVDHPTCAYFKELLEIYPNAKVID